ncbi:hypothetical protein CEXT_360651 [Caerostris extrusa]|uniref:Uncharacterized protein n=1 Tax=Caerostris extrusa TaxID=172846 RepID=A0AAV4XHR8_CAEEX|nr:hypothetical protein CEXT_360651 [Caerostris extrusa]
MAVSFHKQSPRLFFSGSDKSESTANLCPLSSGARKCTSRERWGWGCVKTTSSPPPHNISGDTSDFHLRACTGQKPSSRLCLKGAFKSPKVVSELSEKNIDIDISAISRDRTVDVKGNIDMPSVTGIN